VGDTISYQFTVHEQGDTPLGSVTVSDAKCDARDTDGADRRHWR
jgi:hypothetical protein